MLVKIFFGQPRCLPHKLFCAWDKGMCIFSISSFQIASWSPRSNRARLPYPTPPLPPILCPECASCNHTICHPFYGDIWEQSGGRVKSHHRSAKITSLISWSSEIGASHATYGFFKGGWLIFLARGVLQTIDIAYNFKILMNCQLC